MVQTEEGLGGKLRGEQVECTKSVCGGAGGKSCRLPGVVEWAAPLEVDGSSVEVFKLGCIWGCQPRHMCRDELGGSGCNFRHIFAGPVRQ